MSLGLANSGRIKFSLKNKQIFDLAVAAFNKYSDYKNNVDHLNYFLQALSITSPLEGGFDALNTWDNAGLSVGFIQFARPNVNVYKVISQYNQTLANKVKNAFGTSKNYDDQKSLVARKDITLLNEVQQSIITDEGIDAQFKICIEDFYDPAYKKFLSLTFYDESSTKVTPILSATDYQKAVIDSLNNQTAASQTKKNPTGNKFKIYANSFLFDLGVNTGTGTLNKIKTGNIGTIPMTEGNFLTLNLDLHKRPERKSFWTGVINDNFQNGQITV